MSLDFNWNDVPLIYCWNIKEDGAIIHGEFSNFPEGLGTRQAGKNELGYDTEYNIFEVILKKDLKYDLNVAKKGNLVKIMLPMKAIKFAWIGYSGVKPQIINVSLNLELEIKKVNQKRYSFLSIKEVKNE